jgi:hypothetical protein
MALRGDDRLRARGRARGLFVEFKFESEFGLNR